MNFLKRKSNIFVLLVVLCTLLLCSSFKNLINVSAVSNITLTPEMYTSSDRLLNVDGTLEELKITDFAQTVVTSNDTTNLSDLTKVIPVEYLRTT